ncbi:MAG: hypothetical protein P8Q97_04825 [Myxococcota bacterium]|nr:hypothetical protein [Myxococcota bacterium]
MSAGAQGTDPPTAIFGVDFFRDDYVGEHDLGYGKGSREELQDDERGGILGKGRGPGEYGIGDYGEEQYASPTPAIGDDAKEEGRQSAEAYDGSKFPELFLGDH